MTRTDRTEVVHRPSWWRTSKAWWFIAIIAVLILLAVVVLEKAGNPTQMPYIPYSTFLDQVEAGNVASVTFQGTDISGRYKQPVDSTQPVTFSSRVPDFGDSTLIQELRAQHVVIDTASPPQWTSLISRLPWPMLFFLGVAIIAGLVGLLRRRKVQSGSTASMHPMYGMMGLLSGLLSRQQQGAGRPKHDILAAPTSSVKPGIVTVEVAYLNHPPVQPVLSEVDKLLATYGDRVSVTRYDFDTPEGETFAKVKGLTEHTPLAIFVNGSMQFDVNGRMIKYYRFPQGQSPRKMMEGNWTLQDLEQTLDEITSKSP
jgi:hypothetical protein